MSRSKSLLVSLSVVGLFAGTTACGKLLNCLTGKSCAATDAAEKAATKDLFLRVVSLSLDSFKSVMSELGMTEAQQNTVVTDVQAKAQQQTSQLGLALETTYDGTILENLSAMFQDLMDFTISKVTEVAPNVDKSNVMNACSQFMNDMIANAGLVEILESLPVEEQSELSKDDQTGKLDWEVFRAPLERVTIASFSSSVSTDDVGASLDRFKRRPGAAPLPASQVVAYRPSATEQEKGRERLGNLCQGQPGDVGIGSGSSKSSESADRLPIPDKTCRGVFIDKKVSFCLYAPPQSAKICTKTVYGSDANTANATSITYWIDRTANSFTGFASGKAYDCTVATDRAALAQLLAADIEAKKPGCKPALTPRSPKR